MGITREDLVDKWIAQRRGESTEAWGKRIGILEEKIPVFTKNIIRFAQQNEALRQQETFDEEEIISVADALDGLPQSAYKPESLVGLYHRGDETFEGEEEQALLSLLKVPPVKVTELYDQIVQPFESHEDMAQTLNIPLALAKTLPLEGWTSPKMTDLIGSRAKAPEQMGYADIWFNVGRKPEGFLTPLEDAFLTPEASGQYFRVQENVKARRKDRQTQELLLERYEQRAKETAESLVSIQGTAATKEQRDEFVGKVLAYTPKYGAREAFDHVRDTWKWNLNGPQQLKLARDLARQQKEEGGSPLVATLEPIGPPRSVRPNLYDSYKIGLRTVEEIDEALAEGRIGTPGTSSPAQVRFADPRGLGEVDIFGVEEEIGDRFKKIPFYLSRKDMAELMTATKGDLQPYWTEAPPPPELLSALQQSGEKPLHAFIWAASVLGTPLRAIVGAVTPPLKGQGLSPSLMVGEAWKNIWKDPEKQEYFTTLMNDPEVLRNLGALDEEDYQSWLRYKADIENAETPADKRAAENAMQQFRGTTLANGDKLFYGLLGDLFLDPLTWFTIGTTKSVQAAGAQVRKIVRRTVKQVPVAEEAILNTANKLRTTSGLEPISSMEILGKETGKQAEKEFLTALSPKEEAAKALQTRRQPFTPEGQAAAAADYKKGLPTSIQAPVITDEAQLNNILTGYGYSSSEIKEVQQIAARDVATEPGRFRIALDTVSQQIDTALTGLPQQAINQAKRSAVDVLIQNEKYFGNKGLIFTIPFIQRRVYLNSLDSKTLQGLRKISDTLKALPEKTGISGLISPTPFGSSLLLKSIEDMKLEVAQARATPLITEYLDNISTLDDLPKQTTQGIKDQLLYDVLADSMGDTFLETNLAKKLAESAKTTSLRSWRQGGDLFLYRHLADNVRSLLGEAPKLGKKYVQIAEAAGDSALDAVIAARILEESESIVTQTLQREVDTRALASRLSGAPLTKETAENELRKLFSETIFGGGGRYSSAFDLTQTMKDETKALIKETESLYKDLKTAGIREVDDFTVDWQPGVGSSATSNAALTDSLMLETMKKEQFLGKPGVFASSAMPQELLSRVNGWRKQFGDLPPEERLAFLNWYKEATGKGVTKEFPSRRNYSARQERFLKKDVAYQVDRLLPVLQGEKDIRHLSSAVGKLTQAWKGLATVVNPSFHSRNLMSGAFVYWLGGGSPIRLVDDYGRATRTMAVNLSKELPSWANKVAVRIESLPKGQKELTYAEVRALAEKHGVIDSTFFLSDLPGDLQQVIAQTDEVLGKGMQARGIGQKIMKMPRAAGQFVEGQGRLALFISELRKGSSPAEAAQHTKHFFFDYGALPEKIRQTKTHIPFVTFAWKNLGLEVEQVLKNPGRYSNLLSIARAFNENAKNLYGDDYEKYVPDWLIGATKITAPGRVSPDTDPYLLNFDLPAKSLYSIADFADKMSEGLVLDAGESAIRDVWSAVNPLYKGLALVTGATDSVYDPFRKRYLRRDREVSFDSDLLDFTRKFSPAVWKGIKAMFSIQSEQTKEDVTKSRYFAPETSAYVLQMLPPLVGIWKAYDGISALSFGDPPKDLIEQKEQINRYLKGASYLVGIKLHSVDEIRARLGQLYEINRLYKDFVEEEERQIKTERAPGRGIRRGIPKGRRLAPSRKEREESGLQ